MQILLSASIVTGIVGAFFVGLLRLSEFFARPKKRKKTQEDRP